MSTGEKRSTSVPFVDRQMFAWDQSTCRNTSLISIFRMRDVGTPLEPCRWLGNAPSNRKSNQRRTMDPLLISGRLGVSWWPGIIVPFTPAYASQKTSCHLSQFAQQIGLKISRKKSNVTTLNTPNPSLIQVNGEDLPTEDLSYFGSIVMNDGGAGKDVKNRLCKARLAFQMLKNGSRSQQYSIETKLKLYQSCPFHTFLPDPAWPRTCAQSKLQDIMVCQCWSGRAWVSCTGPWLTSTPLNSF